MSFTFDLPQTSFTDDIGNFPLEQTSFSQEEQTFVLHQTFVGRQKPLEKVNWFVPSVTYPETDEELLNELRAINQPKTTAPVAAAKDDSEDSFAPSYTPDFQPSPPPPQPPSVPAQSKKRFADDNVIYDNCGDDDDVIIDLTQLKKRKRVTKVEDDEDGEDEVMVCFYKKGEVAQLESKAMIKIFQHAFKQNKINTIINPAQLPNIIGTLFFIYDDRRSKTTARNEFVSNPHLVKLCLEGRLRMTPLSKLLAVLDSYDYTEFNLDTLKDCAFPCRASTDKLATRFDPFPLVPVSWRMPPQSITMYHSGKSIINTRKELSDFLAEQMFPSTTTK